MASRRKLGGFAALVWGMLLAGVAAPASAQVAGDLTLQSDYRLRGHSLSGGEPALTLNLAYDHSSGVYLNGAATGAVRHGDPSLIGLTANLGYAYRVAPEVSVDGGVVWSEYRDRFHAGDRYDYTEVYAGFYSRRLSSHLYYSPNYYPGFETLYGEIDGAVETVAKVRLSAHVGILSYLATPDGSYEPEDEYDWRVAASRRFGLIDLRAALSGGGPGPDYYDYEAHDRAALVFSGSWSF